jgi:inositol phosphorylceramide synthase catalytic subunit
VRRRLSFTLVTRIGGLAYIGYLLVTSGPLFYRVVLGAVAAVVVVTCDRWREFALFAAPFLLLILAYEEQRLVSPAITGVRINVTGPRDWELAWFGIHTAHGLVTPAQWFQSHTSPVLDIVCGLVYLGFMEGFIAIAAWWVFRERRAEAKVVMWALLALALICYIIHVLHPTAPPWYVQRYGTGPAVVTAPPEAAGGLRFDRLLGVSWFSSEYSNSTDVFGAMPSLHVGQTFLAALFAWRYRSLRVVATTFFGLVFLASVYLDQHYIVDGLVGMAIAGLVFATTAYILRHTASGAPRNGAGRSAPRTSTVTSPNVEEVAG